MKVAVIGSGITGLGASWLLNYHSVDFTLFEKEDRLGGHANTVQVKGHPAIDTGFIVYNDWTYPNFIALLEHLNVRTSPSDMSFAVSSESSGMEYGSGALFGQKRNLASPRFYRMIADILRFYNQAPKLIERDQENVGLGTYLTKNKYSKIFIEEHLIPMGAAIWSMSPDEMFDFPAQSFVRFFVNHGLLRLRGRPQWRTILNGSQEYVRKISQDFKDKIKLSTPVESLSKSEEGYRINGSDELYTHVIMACHSDQTIKLLKPIDSGYKRVLGNIPYTNNTAYLHMDETYMPQTRACWSSWNYLKNEENKTTLTYWMNKLQPFLPEHQNYFVTLNPLTKPDPQKTLRTINYTHPSYIKGSDVAQSQIKTLQGANNIWLAGAWCGYGFHEDGLTSGLIAAEKLAGIKRPWPIAEEKSSAAQHC